MATRGSCLAVGEPGESDQVDRAAADIQEAQCDGWHDPAPCEETSGRLQLLDNVGLHAVGDTGDPEAGAAQRTLAREKFQAECGTPVGEVGGMVIDEVSFIDFGVFGHLDKDLRTLLDASGALCGGMPILLCGDNHQKPSPGVVNGTPALLDSLKVVDAADQQRLNAAYASGRYCEVTLDKAPQAVNLVVGGTVAAPRLWHEVPLDDLSGLLPDYVLKSNIL